MRERTTDLVRLAQEERALYQVRQLREAAANTIVGPDNRLEMGRASSWIDARNAQIAKILFFADKWSCTQFAWWAKRPGTGAKTDSGRFGAEFRASER